MEHRIKMLLSRSDYGELASLHNAITSGNFDFSRALAETLREKEKEHRKYCSTCGNELEPGNVTTFTIMFGPHDFKKRASFCALDCLEYFIERLKTMKKSAKEKTLTTE